MNSTWFVAVLPVLPFVMTIVNAITWQRPRPVGPVAAAPSQTRRWPRRRGHADVNGIDSEPAAAATPSVSLLIPARNEAHRIEALLASARIGQPEISEILVYDDASTDDTAAVVRRCAEADARVRLLEPHALPEGWLGKAHACHRLARAARAEQWLFVDADVRLVPGAVRALVELRAKRPLPPGVVSAVPRQIVVSFLERLILPLLHLTYLAWMPLRLVEATSWPSLTAANGQLLLVDPNAYARIGGFASIRDAIVDDVAFCRRAKARGVRVSFVDGHELAECRMYEGASGVWQGFSKNLYPGLGNSWWRLLAAASLYLACFVAPYVALGAASLGAMQGLGTASLGATQALGAAHLGATQALGAAHLGATAWLAPAAFGVGTNLALRSLLAWRYRQPLGGILWHPVAVVVLLAIAVNSAIWVLRKRIFWSGRHCDVRVGTRASASRRSDLFVRVARYYVRRRLRRQFEAVNVHGLAAARSRAAMGPILLAANHVAWWDPFLLVALDEALGTTGHCLMDAKHLHELPFFGRLGAIPVHRNHARRAHHDMTRAVQLAQAPGQLLAIFPQGRQTPAHFPLRLEPGVAWLAAKSGAPVIPTAIRYDFGEGPRMVVHVSLGAAISYRSGPLRAFVEELDRAIDGELARIDGELTRIDGELSETTLGTAKRAFAPLLTARPNGRIPLGSRLLSAWTRGEA